MNLVVHPRYLGLIPSELWHCSINNNLCICVLHCANSSSLHCNQSILVLLISHSLNFGVARCRRKSISRVKVITFGMCCFLYFLLHPVDATLNLPLLLWLVASNLQWGHPSAKLDWDGQTSCIERGPLNPMEEIETILVSLWAYKLQAPRMTMLWSTAVWSPVI